MTRPPRPTPPGERALTPADLERFGDRLAGKIEATEERLGDQLADAKARAEAQQKVTREGLAEAAVRDDALRDELGRVSRRTESILAESTRGYRTLETAQTETKEAMELRLKILEERVPPEAAELATHIGAAVIKSNRQDNRRIAGYAMLGGGFGGGALIVGCMNFIANHTKLVVGILHIISLGLVKVTTTPHE